MERREFLKTTAAGALAPLALAAGATAQTAKNPKVEEIRKRISPITSDERQERIEKARRIMKDQNIDAMFFEGGPSLNYYTGVSWGRSERLFAMILPVAGDPIYVAPRFEEARAREQIGKAKMFVWQEHENPYFAVRKILLDNNIASGVLGIEESTRFLVTDNIAKTCPAVDLLNGTVVTAGCRSVKSPHEIELIQIANEITAEVFSSAIPKLKEGMTERELGSIISALFSEFGVTGGALVLFGGASAYPHGLEKTHTLQQHQIVLLDGGCSVEGYNSDVTRTTVFGTPTDAMRKVFDVVRKAQSGALAAARPGVSGEVIDGAARKIITDAGFGPNYTYFTHRLGHGIGMEGHEWYYLVPGNKRLVEAGNLFTDEPGIYIPGQFGIRLEDELLITDAGARLMLPQAKSLESMF